jgi:indolepyruvate ferredoxin oxidoreductase alpha subunit
LLLKSAQQPSAQIHESLHAAVLCPSFYKTSIISNPSIWDRTKLKMRNLIIGFLQNGIERRLVGIDA